MRALRHTFRHGFPWSGGARWTVAVVAVALLVGGWLALDRGRIAGSRARASGGGSGPVLLANVELRDQQGARLPSSVFADKTLVLHFMFTSCPEVCPLQARELVRVQRALPESLKSEVHFLSISVDPEHDTPQALRRFAASTGIDLENWSLATAPAEATRTLALALRAIEPSASSALPAAHGTSIYLFDRRGRLMQRYAGKPLDRQRLVRELESLTRIDTSDTRTAGL